jgi:hypothetical protein
MRKQAIWLILALAVTVLVGVNAAAQDHEFVGASKCKMCHKVQYASWETTKHAKTTEVAKASTERTYEASCLKCHATNATEDLPGVQCEACHGAGGDYKKMSIMKDVEAAKANGLNIPTQATCDGCHTGDDHSSAKVLADEINNKAAIHEFKNPPGE